MKIFWKKLTLCSLYLGALELDRPTYGTVDDRFLLDSGTSPTLRRLARQNPGLTFSQYIAQIEAGSGAIDGILGGVGPTLTRALAIQANLEMGKDITTGLADVNAVTGGVGTAYARVVAAQVLLQSFTTLITAANNLNTLLGTAGGAMDAHGKVVQVINTQINAPALPGSPVSTGNVTGDLGLVQTVIGSGGNLGAGLNTVDLLVRSTGRANNLTTDIGAVNTVLGTGIAATDAYGKGTNLLARLNGLTTPNLVFMGLQGAFSSATSIHQWLAHYGF